MPKRRLAPEPRTLTALHEAAHVVATFVVCPHLRIVAAWIPADGSAELDGDWETVAVAGHHACREGEVIAYYAGTAAERRISPRLAKSLDLGRRDAVLAAGVLEQITGEPPDSAITRSLDRHLRRRARLFVREHWTAIEMVARFLLAHSRISGPQSSRLLGPVLGVPHRPAAPA